MDTVVTQVNNAPQAAAPTKTTPSVSKEVNVVSETNSFQQTLKEVETTAPVVTEKESISVESKDLNINKGQEHVLKEPVSSLITNIVSKPMSETVLPMQQQFIDGEQQLNSESKPVVNMLDPLIETQQKVVELLQPETLEAKPELQITAIPQLNKEVLPLVQPVNVNKEKAQVKKVEKHLISEPKILKDKIEILSQESLKRPELNVDLLAKEVEKPIVEKAPLIANIEINNLNDNKATLQSLSELNSKISVISSITSAKSKSPLGSIKVSAQDASFFSKMVENANNNNNVQVNIELNTSSNQINMTDAKAQALQSSAAVSQALIEKLQASMNTNKAFRVDFDKDVAVIMKVDSNGVLSANFIPGSLAVEQALRNNLPELRQLFNEKGLEYNELSYSSKKQNQNQQQRNKKGEKDE